MRMYHFALASLLSAIFATASGAQTPAPRSDNPQDVVPPQMPFNIAYGPPITLADAKQLIEAAKAEASRHGWPMNIAVVDSGGNLVTFDRMDGAQFASIEIAQHKARAAAGFRRETKVWEEAVSKGNINQLSLDGVIASRGGFPLVRDGMIIGAIGCSGGTSSQDAVVCSAATAMLK